MVQTIPIPNLLLAFAPVLVVIGLLFRWSLSPKAAMYAVARMLLQLLLVGYILAFIFETDRVPVVMSVLAVMLLAASWISLRPLQQKNGRVYLKALLSISAAGISTLVIITQGVIDLETWYQPRFVIPLGSMIFANSMNAVSLAAERLLSETGRGESYQEARRTALRAALIPITNSLVAVGLVSFPGMMTGQILSGVDPLVAARYQIMVMCMIFGSAGLSAALFLVQLKSINE